MKKELSLSEVREVAFKTLLHFKSFCQENNICFYLSNGTLLGAVKYGGFIPWDDDIDVFVPREDYDRLLKIYKDNKNYKLFSTDRNENFKFTFAKLCDATTLKIEKNIDNGIEFGVEIDIFPLDTCSVHILNKYTMLKIKILQNGCILSKFITSKGKPLYKRIIIDVCRRLGFSFFKERLVKITKREISYGSTYAGCLMWPVYGSSEFMPYEIFADTIELSFEGELFPAPVGYDTYLRNLYGSYENDPPVDKQKSHHLFSAFKI